MGVNKQSDYVVGDIVTHTGKRGFWDVSKGYKGVGMILSSLYRKTDRQYVHDVWFEKIGQVQQIGAKALERISAIEVPNE
tara:strand:- start:5 stop:244 length:240 start_codon:yes stop_codon:yes gene_type:complete